MAKKNEKKLTALEQIAALQAQVAALQVTAEAESKELNEKIQKFISDLPLQLSELTGTEVVEATKYESLINVIKQVQKGTLGKVGANVGERSYKSLSEEEKKNLITDRKAGMQYSALTEKYGVSSSTVFNLCEAAGLTAARTPAPAPAPAAAATGKK